MVKLMFHIPSNKGGYVVKKRILLFFTILIFVFTLDVFMQLICKDRVIKAYAVSKMMTHTFEKSTQRTRNTTINIPNLVRVTSITVDTGNVEYLVNGNDISITCRNGNSIDSYTPSQYVSGITNTTIAQVPPSTIYYSSDGYSGTLSRYDYDIVSVVVGYAEESKLFEKTYDNYRTVHYNQDGVITYLSEFTNPNMGNTPYPINEDGYVGAIPRVDTKVTETIKERWPNGNKKVVEEHWQGIYRGTLTKQVPIFEDRYTGYYSGWIYGSTKYYYAYKVTINYVSNQDPNISIIAPTENQLFGKNETSFIPTVMVSDPDGDTLTCKVFIDSESSPRDTKTISNTATAQTVSFNVINISVLTEGNHTFKFTVYDGEKTIESSQNIRVDKTSPTIGEVMINSTDKSINITSSATDNIQMHSNPYRFKINNTESQWTGNTSYTFSELIPNTLYNIVISARDAAGNISQASRNIYTKAGIPTVNLTASGETSLTINITDSNPTGTEYLIRCGSKYVNTSYKLVDSPEWIALNNKTITVTGLEQNTNYSFEAKARNHDGIETEYSSLKSRTTLALPPDTLNFSDISQNHITVSWEGINGATGYELEVDGKIVNTGLSTSYLHTRLLPQTTHNYRVRVINSGGTGNWSNVASCTTLPLPPETPEIIDYSYGRTEITITWSMVPGADGYDVEIDGVVQDNGTQLSYTHKNLEPDSAHFYRVRARNSGGSSVWSNFISITTFPNPPSPPINFSNEKSKESIKLLWEETPKTDAYHIEVDGVIIDNGENNYFLHEGLVPLSEHKYRVRGVNTGGIGEWSDYVYITTHPDKPDSVPDNFMASADGSSIYLTWFMVPHAWTYEVEINGNEIIEVSGTKFQHTDIEPGVSYTYRVRAKNISGTSEWTNPVTISAATAGDMSISNVAAIVNTDSIILQWDIVSDECEYEVEVDGQLIDNGFNTVFSHTGLKPGTYYNYKIRVKSAFKISWDIVITLSTLPFPPEAPTIIDSLATGTSIQIWWAPVEGAISYDLEIDGEVIKDITDVTYIHDGLLRGSTHEYRVRARTMLDISPWSPVLEINTTRTTYEISCVHGEEFSFGLIGKNIQDFYDTTFVVTYDANQIEVIDLCEFTPWNEIINEGLISGTNLYVRYEPGRIEYTVNSNIVPGTLWSGEITSITFRAKETGIVLIDFNEITD